MKNKWMMAALALLAFGFASIPCASAGTEVVQDYGGRQVQPAPRYNYAPHPRPIYYAPRPFFGIGIYPRYGYYGRPWRGGYGYHRRYWRHRHW